MDTLEGENKGEVEEVVEGGGLQPRPGCVEGRGELSRSALGPAAGETSSEGPDR